MSGAYDLRTWLWLPRPRQSVFDFFADAHNLERITPPFLRFRVTSRGPLVMGEGTLIDYRLSLHGVPLRWTSEITNWRPPDVFMDSQRRGPYAEWIHTHTFEDVDGGTMVRDHVRYRLIGPHFAARIINRLLVAPDTRAIFEFRHRALQRAFGVDGTARVGSVDIVEHA